MLTLVRTYYYTGRIESMWTRRLTDVRLHALRQVPATGLRHLPDTPAPATTILKHKKNLLTLFLTPILTLTLTRSS